MNSDRFSSVSFSCIILIMQIGNRNGFVSDGGKYLNKTGPCIITCFLLSDLTILI